MVACWPVQRGIGQDDKACAQENSKYATSGTGVTVEVFSTGEG